MKFTIMITVLVVTAALFAPVAAEGRDRSGCAVKGSETVLASKDARVFVIRKGTVVDQEGLRDPVWAFYGCLRRTDRRVLLGGLDCASSSGLVGDFWLAGGQVAYTRKFCHRASGHGESTTKVSVTSLRSGRQRRNALAFVGVPPPSLPCQPPDTCAPVQGLPPDRKVIDLQLKANGSVAWIGRERGVYSPSGSTQPVIYSWYEVRKADRSGGNVLLGSGLNIHSLRLGSNRRTIHWTKAGTDASARLY